MIDAIVRKKERMVVPFGFGFVDGSGCFICSGWEDLCRERRRVSPSDVEEFGAERRESEWSVVVDFGECRWAKEALDFGECRWAKEALCCLVLLFFF